jgi:alpha-1,6-mannosyltransferase
VSLVAGTGGSVLLAVGALGVGALPRLRGEQQGWAGIDLLRDSAGGRTLATTLAGLGLALLLLAWWRLRAAGPRRQLLAAGLWSLPLLLAPPVGSRDVYAYLAQGGLVHAGLDPYDVGPQALPGPLADSVAAQYAAAPSPYGPVFLALAGRVVALTGQHVAPGVLLLRLLAVAGLLLLAWALPRLAPGDPGRALWLGLANPLVLVHGVGGAHNEALMAGLLAAGLATRSRPALAAVLVTLGGLVKLPALAGLAILTPRRLRPVLLVALCAVATLGLSILWLGPGWLRTSTQGVDGPSLLSPAYGLGRALQAAGVPHGLDAARTAGTLLGGLVAAVLLLRAPRLGPLRALGWALVAVAALAPAVQPWYLLWGLPALAAAGRAVPGLAAASAVLCLAVLPSGVPLLQGPVWGLPVLLAAAAGLLATRLSGRIPS